MSTDPKAPQYQLKDWLDSSNMIWEQPVIFYNPASSPYVETRYIVRVASLDAKGRFLFAIIGSGEIQYKTLTEMQTEFDPTLAIGIGYLPGQQPVEPRHYGVFKHDPTHPKGGHWYTNEAHTWTKACQLAAHYEYNSFRQRDLDWRNNVTYKAEELPEDEWR